MGMTFLIKDIDKVQASAAKDIVCCFAACSATSRLSCALMNIFKFSQETRHYLGYSTSQLGYSLVDRPSLYSNRLLITAGAT